MRYIVTLVMTLMLSVAGCGSDSKSGNEPAPGTARASPAAERGGKITVGEDSWTIVPAIQCSVYPGNIVTIAGHAASDPELEIDIDYGGPNQVRIGNDGGRGTSWHAVRETIEIEIDGKRVRGTATFTESFHGAGESRHGSFDVQC